MIIAKIHYRLMAVDLSLQKDSRVLQEMKFLGQLKKLDANDNATDAGTDQNMFFLTILEKIKRTRLNISRGNSRVSWKMVNYEEARVKLTKTQWKYWYLSKKKTGTTLRITKKTFQDKELPREVFLITMQKTKLEILSLLIYEGI